MAPVSLPGGESAIRQLLRPHRKRGRILPQEYESYGIIPEIACPHAPFPGLSEACSQVRGEFGALVADVGNCDDLPESGSRERPDREQPPRGRSAPASCAWPAGLISVAKLDDLTESHFEDLVIGRGDATLDDGEAATIAYGAEKGAIALIDERKAMRAIIEKAIALGGSRESEYGVSIHPDDLKTIRVGSSRLSDYRISKLSKTLERNGLGWLDVDQEPQLCLSIPDDDLPWSLLKEYLEGRGRTLRDIVCDLKFGLLD